MARIVVIGAGIVGLATAWQLQRRGHQVTVIERRDGVAEGTSFANAGQLSYAYVAPFAGPGVLSRIPRWLLQEDGPLRVAGVLDFAFMRWAARFVSFCNAGASAYTTRRLFELAMLSRTEWDQFFKEVPNRFSFARKGKLIVHRRAGALDAAARTAEALAPYGYVQQRLSAAQCVEVEPALAWAEKDLVGGIYTPGEEAADCYQLCVELSRAMRAGATPVSFRFGAVVTRLLTSGARVTGVAMEDDGEIEADRVIVASGIDARKLLAPIGIELPLWPIKGYSLSIPVDDEAACPHVSVTDYDNKIAYARLGPVLRVAGIADLVGHSLALDKRRVNTLKRGIGRMFPSLSLDVPLAEWTGLRPATPSGRPILGPTRYENLFVNVGHGGLGFTLAMGSARVVADMLDECEQAIELDGFLMA
jgi:D-amino-acid dehydrogenase